MDIRIPKQILKGSCRERRPTGKPRNRCEGKLWKDVTELLNMKNGHTHRSDRKKNRE